MPDGGRPGVPLNDDPLALGVRWRRVFLFVLGVVCLIVATLRFVDPVGELYVPYMRPGAADFYYPYNGARALLRGVNPYAHDEADLFDPWDREDSLAGVKIRQYYPPSHLVYDVPLALLLGADIRLASRVWFGTNLGALVGIALLVVLLIRALRERAPGGDDVELGVLVLVALALNPGVQLGLERGQSDIHCALFYWGAILLFARGKTGFALGLATAATLLKGYGSLFTAGLFLFSMGDPSRRKSPLVGVAVPVAFLLLPVAQFLPAAQAAVRFRLGMWANVWLNQGFRNMAYELVPEYAEAGRLTLIGVGVLVSLACGVSVYRFRHAEPREHLISLIVFALVSLSTMLGAASWSIIYNIIIVVPGVLVLGLSGTPLAAMTTRARTTFWSVALLVILCLTWLVRGWRLDVNVSSFGLAALLVLGAFYAIATLGGGGAVSSLEPVSSCETPLPSLPL